MSSHPRILFYPELPRHNTILYKICALLGYGITNDPGKRSALAIKWRPDTFFPDDDVLIGLAGRYRLINRACTDISKVRVNEVFEKIFDYPIGVDPCTYEGLCVEKSNLNAQHDGRVIRAPLIDPKEGYAYQRLVNMPVDAEGVVDLRVPIIGRRIPLVYQRFKPLQQRFATSTTHVRITATHDEFEPAEVADILRFCEALGLDYGELDVLRDVDDGRLYIVDVNNTPYGPPKGINPGDGRRSTRLLAAAFEDEFMGGA